jgi:hypothetical protein
MVAENARPVKTDFPAGISSPGDRPLDKASGN